jgi:hypothetical protein
MSFWGIAMARPILFSRGLLGHSGPILIAGGRVVADIEKLLLESMFKERDYRG